MSTKLKFQHKVGLENRAWDQEQQCESSSGDHEAVERFQSGQHPQYDVADIRPDKDQVVFIMGGLWAPCWLQGFSTGSQS